MSHTETAVTIERIRYNENGRVIAQVKAAGHHRLSIIGDMDEPQVGASYIVIGDVKPNEQYGGEEIRFTAYRSMLPDSAQGIFNYLVDVARWVGPQQARALIKAYGDDTLKTIKDEPERVAAEINGITPERAAEMSASLVSNERNETAMIEMHQICAGAVGPQTARKAIRRWGARAPHIIRRNPFKLAQLAGVGFKMADAVFKKLGGEPTELRRHVAGVHQAVVDMTSRDGHTIVNVPDVIRYATSLLGMSPDERALPLLQRARWLSRGEDGRTTLDKLYQAESYIAGKLADIADATVGVEKLFPAINIDGLADEQIEAVEKIARAPVAALVGAPGTGKTYTTARIIDAWKAAGLSVALCAPTGKAAKQMGLALARAGVTGKPSTIHSLLKPAVDVDGDNDADNIEFKFEHGPYKPLKIDAIVVDETSMVDSSLLASLLGAVPAICRVLFVGDPYQLPSVGPGATLRDILVGGVPHFELKTIRRNAGTIVEACHKIKDGKTPAPVSKLALADQQNWRHVETAGDDQTAKLAIELATEILPTRFGFDPTWQIQTISPVNERGPLACDPLNSLLRGIINPAGQQEGKLPIRVGDKVVRCKNGSAPGILLPDDASPTDDGEASELLDGNSDEIRIVNGDIGTVRAITKQYIELRLRWPERIVRVKRSAHELKLAYCMTCHKLQGSECEAVVLPLSANWRRMPLWIREWIYTAMSRAKIVLVTVGQLDALRRAVQQTGFNRRTTKLGEHLNTLKFPLRTPAAAPPCDLAEFINTL